MIFVARPNGHTHRMIQRILEVKDRDSAHPLPEELKNYLGENWKAVRDEIVDALTPIVTAERGSEDRGIFVEKNCAFVPGRGVLLNDETPGDGGEEESRDEFAHVPGYGACALMETIESVLHTEYHRSDHLRATIVYGSHDRETFGEMNAMQQSQRFQTWRRVQRVPTRSSEQVTHVTTLHVRSDITHGINIEPCARARCFLAR